MKRLLALLALLPALAANAAQIWTVNSVADPADPLPLVWLNANTINTNVFAAYGTSWGDNAGGLWTFKRADATATNTVALGGPVESVNPLSPAGRWFKLIPLNTSAPTGAATNYWLLSVSGGATNLQPVELGWQPLVGPGWFVGTNSKAILGHGLTNGEALYAGRDISTGEPNLADIKIKVRDGAGNEGGANLNAVMGKGAVEVWDNYSGGAQFWDALLEANASGPFLDLSSEAGSLMTLRPAVGVTPYRFDTAAAHAVSNLVEVANNGTNQITLGPLAQIGFGTGGTNVLFRDGSNLVMTNGATQVEHEVRNGLARSVFVGFTASGQGELRVANGATAIWLDNGTDKAVLFGGGFAPNTAVSLGLNSDPWHGMYLTNHPSTATNYIYFGTNQMSVIGSDLYWNGTKLN